MEDIYETIRYLHPLNFKYLIRKNAAAKSKCIEHEIFDLVFLLFGSYFSTILETKYFNTIFSHVYSTF